MHGTNLIEHPVYGWGQNYLSTLYMNGDKFIRAPYMDGDKFI